MGFWLGLASGVAKRQHEDQLTSIKQASDFAKQLHDDYMQIAQDPSYEPEAQQTAHQMGVNALQVDVGKPNAMKELQKLSQFPMQVQSTRKLNPGTPGTPGVPAKPGEFVPSPDTLPGQIPLGDSSGPPTPAIPPTPSTPPSEEQGPPAMIPSRKSLAKMNLEKLVGMAGTKEMENQEALSLFEKEHAITQADAMEKLRQQMRVQLTDRGYTLDKDDVIVPIAKGNLDAVDQAKINKLNMSPTPLKGEAAFTEGFLTDESNKLSSTGKPVTQAALDDIRLKAHNLWTAAGRDPAAQALLLEQRRTNTLLANAKLKATSDDQINSLAEDMTAGRIAPSQIKNAFGLPISNMVVQRALAMDPGFNAQEADSNYAYGKSTSTQNRVRAIDNLTMPGGAFDQLEQFSNTLTRSGSPWLNKPYLEALQGAFGDQAVAVYNRVATEVSVELAMALTTGTAQLSDSRVQLAMKLTDPDLNVAQIRDTLKASRGLLSSRRQAVTAGTYLSNTARSQSPSQPPTMPKGGSPAPKKRIKFDAQGNEVP